MKILFAFSYQMRSDKNGNTHHVYSGFTVYFAYIYYITYVQNILLIYEFVLYVYTYVYAKSFSEVPPQHFPSQHFSLLFLK